MNNITKPEPQDVTPWREMESLSDRMRHLMEASFPSLSRRAGWPDMSTLWPAVELVEDDGEYVLSAELPGLAKEDLDISVDDGELTLKGEKKRAHDEQQGKTLVRERSYGAFERCFRLPRNVAADDIRAEFHDGIVEIHMPKQADLKPHKIDIQ